MTSSFRLLAAIALAVAAFALGLASDTRSAASQLEREARTIPEIDAWTAAEVDGLVSRIADAGLYPDAVLDRSEAGAAGEADAGEVGMGEVEAAFVDPSLRAFINVGGVWRLVIHREGGESRVLESGDVLTDDWQVTSISATSVTFERGDETRTLDAYPSREG